MVILENFNDSKSSSCFYCQEYQLLYSDVPLNEVIHEMNGITPRCFLHYKYECSSCGLNFHFNGISWCIECKIMTCIDCGEEKIENKKFLIYEYYFEINCIKCGTGNPALDYAEFSGVHPYQIGDLWPNQPINIWLPMIDEDAIESRSYQLSGSQRILNLSTWNIDNSSKLVNDISSKNLTQNWYKFLGKDYQTLLNNLIFPEILKMMEIKPKEQILEIGCGEGQLSRLLAESGANVIGIDSSNIISKAITSENNQSLNISYHKTNIEDFKDKYEGQKFNKIVCNLRIMAIVNLSTFFENVFYHLMQNGDFIFSISHPFSGLPNALPIRIPEDSLRNEDQFWMSNNYFEEGQIQLAKTDDTFDLILFRRTLSTYLNNMISAKFSLIEISEPQANSDIIEKFPKQMYNNNNINPGVMIIKARRS